MPEIVSVTHCTFLVVKPDDVDDVIADIMEADYFSYHTFFVEQVQVRDQ